MPTLRADQIMVNPTDGTRYEIPLSYGANWSDAAQCVYRTPAPAPRQSPAPAASNPSDRAKAQITRRNQHRNLPGGRQRAAEQDDLYAPCPADIAARSLSCR